jgi:hypothetical protein
MPQEQCPAAVSLKPQLIKNFFPVLAFLHSLAKILPQMSYWLVATEASDWYNHNFTSLKLWYFKNKQNRVLLFQPNLFG